MHHSATSLLILAETRQRDLLAEAAPFRRIPIGGPRRHVSSLPSARCRAVVGGLLVRAGQTLQGGPAVRAGTAPAGR
jgi:hypothetical protein